MRTVACFLFALALTPAHAQQLPAGPLPESSSGDAFCGIKADSVAKIREGMGPEWKKIDSGTPQYDSFANERSYRILVFTINGARGHLAAVCRHIVPTPQGGSSIDMTVTCEADKSACDQLVRDFNALDREHFQGARP